ncbi:putative CCR4 associated factor [Leishmania mexicana MHOM/GT/2001/U1103]|uniref:poly(A)-specific ribonuclease n=1 Tax=Leishmania mexicana (strain MHOM/GT/2001/U1103) TaxID=929439 RepID=E9AVZ5_LEIMU|nr:putative CCR4 associated factor [Leishmania mexicana MHOM/GT/2001/U1103]CBZ27128.1 putative CCR4 associated factor [Leishmania mexicana MHOM/GT/2001/U1103]
MTSKHNPQPYTMTASTPAWNPETRLPSLSKSTMIRDVWADNLEEEFATIRSLIKDYSFVSLDTEFPGVVAKPVGSFKTTHEFYYQTLRCNVNLLKIIQLGITLLNDKGEVPEHCSTWQFNFRFSIKEDVYAQDSIELLRHGGINFDYFNDFGIEVTHFAELLISSGLVLNSNVRWLAFHAGYDFGYLIKVVCNKDLPEKEEEFLQTLHALFPSMFDLKYLLRFTEVSHSFGLDYLAESLKLRRFGTAHQAGSDSLLTGHCYFKLLRDSFGNTAPVANNGVLYGLSEDAASSVTPSSAQAVTQVNSNSHNFSSPIAYGNGGASGGTFPAAPINSNIRRP